MASRRQLSEQETIIRWDRESTSASLYTAYKAQADRWRRRGYVVAERHGGWWADVPIKCISFRSPATKPRNPIPEEIHKRRITSLALARAGRGKGAATSPPVQI